MKVMLSRKAVQKEEGGHSNEKNRFTRKLENMYLKFKVVRNFIGKI